MEAHHQERIRKNLPKLLECTKCSVKFLAYLLAKKHLSSEEMREITGSFGAHQEAFNLYDIIRKRKDSFPTLLDALKETDQLEAFSILTEDSPVKPFRSDTSPDLVAVGLVNIEYNELIGCRPSGIPLYKGKYSKNHPVAIEKRNLDYDDRQDVQNEIRQFKKLKNHPNILQLFGAESSGNAIYIAVEFFDATLSRWVKEQQVRTVLCISVQDIMHQITSGIEHIHSLNVVHRKLTPDNVFLIKCSTTKPVCVKIGGFGLSRQLPITERRPIDTKQELQSSSDNMWTAPEILNHFCEDTVDYMSLLAYVEPGSDIFSLGCIFYYLITNGKHPFGDQIRAPGNILNGISNVNPKDCNGCFPEYLWIVILMIGENVKNRPSASYILDTPIFWSNGKLYEFLCTAYRLQGTATKNTWEKINQWAIEIDLILKRCNSWLPNLCEGFQLRAAHQKYNKSLIEGLLRFIKNSVRGAFTGTVDPYMAYFTTRYRYLATIVWISFQNHMSENVLSGYYNPKNRFDEAVVKTTCFSLIQSTALSATKNSNLFLEDLGKAIFNAKSPELQNFISSYPMGNTRIRSHMAAGINQFFGVTEAHSTTSDSDGADQTFRDHTISVISVDMLASKLTAKKPQLIPLKIKNDCDVVDHNAMVDKREYKCNEARPNSTGNLDIQTVAPKSKKRTIKSRFKDALKFGTSGERQHENESTHSSGKNKPSDLRTTRNKMNTDVLPQSNALTQTTSVPNKPNDFEVEAISISRESSKLKMTFGQVESIDQKVYLRWVNVVLRPENIMISDLFSDFKDGVVLMKLVSTLGGSDVGEPHKIDKTKITFNWLKKDNIRRAVNYLREKFRFKEVKLDAVSEGEKDETEMMMKGLIQTFHLKELRALCEESNPVQKTARNKLLTWCQNMTEGYRNVNITDFCESWKSGLALCALVHSCFSNSFDYKQLAGSNSTHNFETALGVLEMKFGIPRLFDASDVATLNLTENAIICQIAYIYRKCKKNF